MDFAFDPYGIWPMVQGIIIVVWVFSGLIALAFWVLQCLGLMRMARKVGFADPWLAWIPGASDYLFIKLAGPSRRKMGIAYIFMMYLALPALLVLFCIAVTTLIASVIPVIANALANSFNWGDYGGYNFSIGGAVVPNVGAILLLVLGCIALFALSIVIAVFYYILLYHVFKRFKPRQAALFLVLSIIFGLGPIFLFVASFGHPEEKAVEGTAPPAPPVPPVDQAPSFTPPAGY